MNSKMFNKKIFFRFVLCTVLVVFLGSCSQQEISAPASSESSATYSQGVLAGDFAPGQLEAHYLKHRYEFGNISQEQYLFNAQNLLNSAPNNDIIEKIRPNGDVLHYRVSTGEFAVMAKDGRIRTYFKTNYRYWLKQ